MSTPSMIVFLKTETGSGLLLALAALSAVIWANSPWASAYDSLTHHVITVQLGSFSEAMGLSSWVKAALMPIFFFVIGLEIKHEILRGELSNPRRLALPLLAAAGGVVGPAVVYLALNQGPTGAISGWPIPTATDIAFALSALAIVGRQLPPSLRIFLLTLAIVDDLVAVILIAVMFTASLDLPMLAGAGLVLAAMAGLSRRRAAPIALWVLCALILWGFAMKSGINTSLAGVAAALCIPLAPRRPDSEGQLSAVMAALHPYVAFFILPLFAFTASGFSLQGSITETLLSPVALGIAAGLFFGKQIGVFGATALAIGLTLAKRPSAVTWMELYGVSALCGVGFTMSLYIGALAFPDTDVLRETQVRAGVVLGSLASALLGIGILALCASRRDRKPQR